MRLRRGTTPEPITYTAPREVEVNGVSLKARDGAAIEDESVVKITALKDSEIILVDAA
jgi:hypothetical protein